MTYRILRPLRRWACVCDFGLDTVDLSDAYLVGRRNFVNAVSVRQS